MKPDFTLIFSFLLFLFCPVFGEPVKHTPPLSDIEKTKPLDLKPVKFTKKDVEITVTPLFFEDPLLSTSTFRGLKALAVGGGKIHLLRRTGNGYLLSYNLPKNAGEKLKQIGEVGDLTSGYSESVALNTDGELFVGGYRGTAPVKDGKIQDPIYKNGPLFYCPVTGKGVVAENNGFVLVSDPGSGKGEPVAFEGFYKSKQAWRFGDLIALSYSVEKEKYIQVVDRNGQPQFSFGNRKDAFALDGFCWIHGIAATKDQLFVLDSNCRKISVWSHEGKFIEGIKAGELGLGYPWLPGIAFDRDGTAYLGVSQKRKGEPENTVYESVILKIEGLQNLK